MNTERLIIRDFTEEDIEAVFEIFSDEDVNRFLPWFLLGSVEEAREFYEKRLARDRSYAVCMKEDNIPIGYVTVGGADSFDLGYGLKKEFWHRGIMTEAAGAVLAELKREGIPYITATHDVENPKSGEVMKRLGMKYRYSYEEQWQPKNIKVVFRMYNTDLLLKPYAKNLRKNHICEFLLDFCTVFSRKLV